MKASGLRYWMNSHAGEPMRDIVDANIAVISHSHFSLRRLRDPLESRYLASVKMILSLFPSMSWSFIAKVIAYITAFWYFFEDEKELATSEQSYSIGAFHARSKSEVNRIGRGNKPIRIQRNRTSRQLNGLLRPMSALVRGMACWGTPKELRMWTRVLIQPYTEKGF